MTGSHLHRFGLVFAMLSFVVVLGCKDSEEPADPDREYELVWSDDFDGASGSAIDTGKWSYDLGRGSNGWGNGELQSYTDDTQNVGLDGNGHLVITAIKESDGSYTSGRIKTQGKFTHQFGRIEARIKTPSGQGIWPAFWMLGQNIKEVGWPQCGEIDIMEQKGDKPFVTYGSMHGPGYSAGNAITNSYRLETGNFNEEYFVYAVEWGEDYMIFYLNDEIYGRISPEQAPGEWVYDQPFFLLLNVAVGGSFVGPPDENTSFPQSMHVDYVKVYREK